MLDRITHAERLADGCPRAAEPMLRDWDGADAEALIVLAEVRAEFGIFQALVTIEGSPTDWRVSAIELPTCSHRFARYLETKRYFREDWEQINERGVWLEREFWRAAKAEITDDMATDALRREMGE